MRERVLRQTSTLERISVFLQDTDFTDPRAQHLKEEVLVHQERVLELANEHIKARVHADARRRAPRFTKNSFREQQLLPLSRRGRKLGRDYPELLPALKVPHKNAGMAEIVDAAERMADALTPHLNVLIEARYPRNCLEALRRDARALRDQADKVQAARDASGRSNRELTRELAIARDTIDELDSVLRSLANYKKDYRGAWESCNRVSARMGRPSKRRIAARERKAARSKKREDRSSADD